MSSRCVCTRRSPARGNLANGLLSRSCLRSTTRLKGCRASLRPACTSLSPNRSLSARLIQGCLRNRRAWVGSLQYCLIFVPSVVLGRAMDVGIFIVPFTCGCIFYGEFLRSARAVEHQVDVLALSPVVSIFLTAQTTEYYQVLLAQGIMLGISAGGQLSIRWCAEAAARLTQSFCSFFSSLRPYTGCRRPLVQAQKKFCLWHCCLRVKHRRNNLPDPRPQPDPKDWVRLPFGAPSIDAANFVRFALPGTHGPCGSALSSSCTASPSPGACCGLGFHPRTSREACSTSPPSRIPLSRTSASSSALPSTKADFFLIRPGFMLLAASASWRGESFFSSAALTHDIDFDPLFLRLYTPLSYLDVSGTAAGLGTFSSYLISIANATSIIGRLVPGL